MKKIVIIISLLLVLLMASSCYGMGPLMVDAHKTVCDRNTEADTSGYYIYWRVTATPPNAWDNAKRSPLIPQPPVGQLGCQYDLLNFNLPNGNYEIVATAIDVSGNESGPSNIVPFLVDIPNTPSGLKKQ